MTENIMLTIGSQIRTMREKHGLTQAELGDLIGKTSKTVSSYENGKRMMPVGDLPALAKALNVSLFYFFLPMFVEPQESVEAVHEIFYQMNTKLQKHWINLGVQLMKSYSQNKFSETDEIDVTFLAITVKTNDSIDGR